MSEPISQTSAPQKPRRQGLFRSHPHETMAAIAAGAAIIGVTSLALECWMAQLTGQGPPGAMLGLPVPFISAPLGLGALVIGAQLLLVRPRLASLPLISAAIYWALALWLWP